MLIRDIYLTVSNQDFLHVWECNMVKIMNVSIKVIAAACCLAQTMNVSAQSYVEKHKHGDWYAGIGVGYSQCLAENAVASDFIANQLPSYNVMVGYNFTPVFGMRLLGGFNMHTSRCNDSMVNGVPEVYGSGRYKFKCWNVSLSGVANITNLFFGYDETRVLTWNFIFGGGVIGTFDFDKKLKLWNQLPYYPVDDKGGIYPAGHMGLQCALELGKALDFCAEVRGNMTDNKYNGVSNSNKIDFYLDVMLNLVYHFKNGKQGMRRFQAPPRQPYMDPVLAMCSTPMDETVRYGEAMRSTVPFYSGFYYLNESSMRRVEQVARFLRANHDVSLTIVGHPDIIADDDREYHLVLAEKRAEVVRKSLVEDFGIDPSRLTVDARDTALQSYKRGREWGPAVSFVMRKNENGSQR